MSALRANWAVGALSAALALVAVPAAGQSLSDDPIKLGDDPKPAPPKGNQCKALHEVSVYRPGHPIRETGAEPNHRTIQEAICHAGKGASPEVILYGDPNNKILPGFEVTKPNLRVRAVDAADGGGVAIAQSKSPSGLNGACVVVNPGVANGSASTLIGFDFIADGGRAKPCVVVKSGGLTLDKSKVLLLGPGVAIDVAPTATLAFTGGDYEEHGVFALGSSGGASADAPASAGSRVGVRAGESEMISLAGVRLEGLDVAVETRARKTRLEDVHLIANGVGVDIADAALRSAYAPHLEVAGGRFDENDVAGIKVSRQWFGELAGTAPSGDARYAYRGALKVSGGPNGDVAFRSNAVGILFDNAFPRRRVSADGGREPGLVVERARFVGQTGAAVDLSLPASGAARFRDVEFASNAVAVKVHEVMNGALTIDGSGGGGSRITGGGAGVDLTLGGAGEFQASLSSVAGLAPAFRLSKASGGVLLIAVEDGRTSKDFLKLDQNSTLCRYNLAGAKEERERFKRAFKEFNVLVGRRHISRMFGADSPDDISPDEMKAAQRALCSA